MKIKFVLYLILVFIGFNANSQNRLQSKSSIEIIREAWKHKENDEIKKAETAFRSVSVNDTNYVLAQKELALLYMGKKRFKESNEILEDLLKHEIAFDERAALYFILAQSYNGEELYDKAIDILDEGIKEYPMNHILFYVKGLTYELKEDFQNALEMYKFSIQRNMNFHDAHLRLGVLAANEARYTEAMMSLMSCLMVEPNGESAFGIMSFLEEIADGSFTPEKKGITLSENGDKFDHINLLFSNKIALQSKYKVKFTVTTSYARQMHLILSTVDYNKSDEGFWHQQYLPFYKEVYNAGLLDAMVLFSLQQTRSQKTASKVASKRSTIDKFLKVAGGFWTDNNLNQRFEYEGEVQDVAVLYQNTGIVVGKKSSDNLPIGNWYYYHPQGNLKLIGPMNDKGERNGTFKSYDHFNNNLVEETEYVNNVQTGIEKNYYKSGELEQIIKYKDNKVVDTVYNYFRGGQIRDVIPLKDGKRHGLAITYYENGQVRYQTNFVDGVASGEYASFHANGKPEATMQLDKGLGSGPKKSYYPDGQLEYEYILKNDLIEGSFKKYYPNGKIAEESQMKAGKYFGETKSYYSNGNIYSKGQYDEGGKENGTIEYYDSNGKKYLAYDFKKGSVEKLEVFDVNGKSLKVATKSGKKMAYQNYYPTRHLYCEGEIVDDQRSGLWKYYDDYGVLEKTEKYVNGKLQDSVIFYFPNGKIESISTVKDDQRDGIYLRYNIFGKLIQEGKYSEGKAVNDWYEYYPDGSIMEEYAFKMDEQHGYFRNYGVNGKIENYDIYSDGIIVATVHLDTNENELQRFGQYNGEIKLRDVLNKYDRLVANYNSGVSNGEVKWYDPENRLTTKGSLINGKREGAWTWYFLNGNVWKVTNYKNGDLHGEHLEYHENGKVARRQMFQYGNSEGASIFYFNNGIKESESNFVDDLRDGKMIRYGYDGSIQQIRYYDRGVLISYTYLDKDGKELPPVMVEKGESSFTVYFQSGQKSVEQTRVNGKLNGVYKEYYPDGKLMTESNYYYGSFDGPHKTYHPNGKIQRESVYKFDVLEGEVKEYHSNGNLKEVSDYHLGERHGERKIYSEKGELIKTYIYYNDQMVGVK